MPATPITNSAPGESLVGTEPQLLQQIDPGWRHRLNLFTGRALSDTALDSEQLYRAGLLTTLGQNVTAGTVRGLALEINANTADPAVTVSPGYGISASGEDVVLHSALKTNLSTLAVIEAVSGNQVLTFREFVLDPTNKTFAGILILQPVIAQVSGQTLDTGGPVVVSGNLGASCNQDPAEFAFEDWQIADAVRLVFLPWPSGVSSLPLPPVAPQSTWRNRLAYSIFEAEALLGPDDQLPWAMLGVPVALVGFDPGIAWAASTAFNAGQFITDPNGNVQLVQTAGTSGGTEPANWSSAYGGTTADGGVTWINNGRGWKPLFVDCSSVVRAGGLPRQRYVVPAQTAPLRVWQSTTIYSLGDYIVDPNGDIQKVHVAGTSGGPPPAWNTAFGGITSDGSMNWENFGPSTWQPNYPFAVGQFIYDSSGNLQFVQTSGTSGAKEPDWNGIYLPTTDETVTWINNGSGNPPIVQPALAQARINQLSEQLSQTMSQRIPFKTFADILPTMPPSGILPATALDFVNKRATWFPANWAITAAPVFLEELEAVLLTGMTSALLEAESTPPEDPTLMEPVEVLVPLGDSVYDPNILVTETVAPIFKQEVDQATTARNLTLRDIQTVEQELNTLFAALGPNSPVNTSLIDADGGLTLQEVQGRNGMPPYSPASNETFGTLLQSTWLPANPYTAGQFVVDGNGTLQVVQTAGTSGSGSPNWNTNEGQTTPDGVLWVNNGNATWQANQTYTPGQMIIDALGNIQLVQIGGMSGSAAPAWDTRQDVTTDNKVTWLNQGRLPWQPSQQVIVGQVILDPNGVIQVARIGGMSGANQPAWRKKVSATTSDAQLTWLNNGQWSWQPNTGYVAGQFVLDLGGFMQVVTTGGVSASSPPSWNENSGQTTPDGIAWLASGNALWESDFVYSAGQMILDTQGNVQRVQSGGISGDSAPSWNFNNGQTTQDSGVTWICLGRFGWQANTSYAAGQAIVDSNGEIELVLTAGISGATQPAWNQQNSITQETSVQWTNSGPLTWQPSKAYTAGQILLDSNGNIQFVETPGTSGAAAPAWSTTPAGTTEDSGVTWAYLAYYSTQLVQLQQVAGQAPYTKTFLDSQGVSHTMALISGDDFSDLETNGLTHLIARLSARISQANDLLDTAFLTSQTDIYRFRQFVLGATAATTLATSPILANIATGETATATATNLHDYITSLQSPSAAKATTGSTGTNGQHFQKAAIRSINFPVVLTGHPTETATPTFTSGIQPKSLRSQAVMAKFTGGQSSSSAPSISGIDITRINPNFPTIGINRFPGNNPPLLNSPSSGNTLSGFSFGGRGQVETTTATTAGGFEINIGRNLANFGPSQIQVPGKTAPASTSDITSQSPIAGAELNIRTLTIAERLQQSPSQEAMFYSIGNRLSFLQVLQMLETDLNISVDDLPILVDGPAPAAPAGVPATVPIAIPVETHTFSEWLDPKIQLTIQGKIQSPYLAPDSAEATLFSVGVRVVEQHSMLLRALEARVQQYSDFVSLCNTTLGAIQSNIQQAQTYITQLKNNLLQERQNVAFTTALLSDEIERVETVNSQRLQILTTSVQLIAYTRARTLRATDTVPSRQLVPANVTSPVPACLNQSVSIPPELREIVSQLREAPINWLPGVAVQLSSLERPILLQQLALSAQARAYQQLQFAALPSSAAGEPGVYAPAISTVYNANLEVFRGFQADRASFQPAAIANLSWSLQVATVQSFAAVNDLISAISVHTEISNATARAIQQISSVATCLYTRAGLALPIDRLAWAEYLSGTGISVSLRSLAVLPNWNQLSYIDRQQMQLLVDWLFQQIDSSNATATGFMSDVVRTAILLASDVPIDNIIPGNILIRTLPVVGGVVSLNLPSERIASGMFVQLFSGAMLAARAVVTDLDSNTAIATVTEVFQRGVYLEASDTAHFTTLTPQAVALRPLFQLS